MPVRKRAGAFVVVLVDLKVAPTPSQAKARILAIIDSVNGNLTALTGQLEAKVQTLIDSLTRIFHMKEEGFSPCFA